MTTRAGAPRLDPAPGVPERVVSPRAGFSLVEVIIAMLILTIGVLGLATTTAHIVRQITLGDLMTERSVAFQTVIDRLQALPYDDVGSGTDVIGAFDLRWTSIPDGPQSKIVRIWTRGPGVGGQTFPTNDPVRVDSFDFRVLRR
jgi:prepilin-type N-terminal cleavage/methylation domain-containing protein